MRTRASAVARALVGTLGRPLGPARRPAATASAASGRGRRAVGPIGSGSWRRGFVCPCWRSPSRRPCGRCQLGSHRLFVGASNSGHERVVVCKRDESVFQSCAVKRFGRSFPRSPSRKSSPCSCCQPRLGRRRRSSSGSPPACRARPVRGRLRPRPRGSPPSGARTRGVRRPCARRCGGRACSCPRRGCGSGSGRLGRPPTPTSAHRPLGRSARARGSRSLLVSLVGGWLGGCSDAQHALDGVAGSCRGRRPRRGGGRASRGGGIPSGGGRVRGGAARVGDGPPQRCNQSSELGRAVAPEAEHARARQALRSHSKGAQGVLLPGCSVQVWERRVGGAASRWPGRPGAHKQTPVQYFDTFSRLGHGRPRAPGAVPAHEGGIAPQSMLATRVKRARARPGRGTSARGAPRWASGELPSCPCGQP